jgi:hypothetical protein
VELALLMPVLLFFGLGVLDFGRLFYTYIGLTNAAREGARYAAFTATFTPPECDVTAIQNRVKSEQAILFDDANNFNLRDSSPPYTITVDCGPVDRRTVVIDYKFRPVTQMLLFTVVNLGADPTGAMTLQTWATMPL